MNVSFIIPAYNAQRYLEYTLHTIVMQEGQDYEIIVVNDGSTDRTEAIVLEFAQRHSCIRLISSENRGVSHARNLGIEAARGKYLAFVDADDGLCAGAYSHDMELLLRDCSYDMISFSYICSDDKMARGRLIPERNGVLYSADPGFHSAATRKGFYSYLYHRDLVRSHGFFTGIRYGEDTVFCYLAARQAKSMLQLDRYWYIFRNHLGSAIHNTGGWGYILTDCIPAWYRAGCALDKSEVRWDCYGMVYSLMGEYLRLGAMSGVPLKRLHKDLADCAEFREVCSRPGEYWTREKTVARIQAFRLKPRRIWLLWRLAGLVVENGRRFSRLPMVRRLYFRLKYRALLARWVIPPAKPGKGFR